MKRIVGMAERLILSAAMALILSIVERLLVSSRDVRSAGRVWARLKRLP